MKKGTNTAKKLVEINNLPAIDWKLCLKLASYKATVAQEILTFMLQQLPTDLKVIKERQANALELLYSVHKLHGALCYSGLPRLKNVVNQLENYLKQQPKPSPAKIKVFISQLEYEVQAILAESVYLEELQRLN